MNPLTEKLREGLVCLVPNPGVEMPSCHENTICDCTVLKLLDVIDLQREALETFELIVGYAKEENPDISKDELAHAVSTIAKQRLDKADDILKGIV